MNEIKSFTSSILKELSNRMKSRNKKVNIQKELITLEGLMKSSYNKKDAHYKTNTSQNNINNNISSDRKRVLTQKDMESMGDIQELQINKGDIVTPLALDLLKKRKIKLVIK